MKTAKKIRSVPFENSGIRSMALHPSGKQLVFYYEMAGYPYKTQFPADSLADTLTFSDPVIAL